MIGSKHTPLKLFISFLSPFLCNGIIIPTFCPSSHLCAGFTHNHWIFLYTLLLISSPASLMYLNRISSSPGAASFIFAISFFISSKLGIWTINSLFLSNVSSSTVRSCIFSIVFNIWSGLFSYRS